MAELKDETFSGRNVIPALAEIFQQLYLKPGEEGEALYQNIVSKGKDAPTKDLSHFKMNDKDTCGFEKTPAGPVRIVTLHERADFEMFLQIMGEKCVPVKIPATQGAEIIDGIVNHSKIQAHKDQFYAENPNAGFFGWADELKKFQEDKRNYTEAMIILSAGAYSGIPASAAGFSEEEWIDLSMSIRKYHECTHFVCRRLFPDKISAVWDELVADTIGLYGTFGRFEPDMADLFLGISNGRYSGGRLENYVKDRSEDKMSELAEKIHSIFMSFREICESNSGLAPFDMAVLLEKQQDVLEAGLK